MVSKLKRQAAKNAVGKAALEQLVIEAHKEGRSLRTIAAAAELTPEGVRRMLKRLDRENAEPVAD